MIKKIDAFVDAVEASKTFEEFNSITVEQEDGTEVKGQVVFNFTLPNGKEYITYSLEEVDENGLETLYTASVEKDENGSPILNGTIEDEEWVQIKEVMKKTLKKAEEE